MPAVDEADNALNLTPDQRLALLIPYSEDNGENPVKDQNEESELMSKQQWNCLRKLFFY